MSTLVTVTFDVVMCDIALPMDEVEAQLCMTASHDINKYIDPAARKIMTSTADISIPPREKVLQTKCCNA